MAKIIGVVPARLSASRFPGKPLKKILQHTMLEHCYLRARQFYQWDKLVVSTPDHEILSFCSANGIPAVLSSMHHSRALDRVLETYELLYPDSCDDDIVVNVQGDEPLLRPEHITNVIDPLLTDSTMSAMIAAQLIENEADYRNPDILKIIHDLDGKILYTSRSPIPYMKEFQPNIVPRIIGIFSFKYWMLRKFGDLAESRLEKLEACDSNRLYDNGFYQHIALCPTNGSHPVDSPSDLELVIERMKSDNFYLSGYRACEN